jgi:hypothetical protein
MRTPLYDPGRQEPSGSRDQGFEGSDPATRAKNLQKRPFVGHAALAG